MVNTALQISTLTYSDDIYLHSTLHALSNQDFICSTCMSRYKDRPAMAAKWRKTKGCEEIIPGPLPLHTVNKDAFRIKYNTCIGNFFAPSVVMWIEAYRKFDKGIMPYSGGYMEQPNKAIEILRVIEADFQTKAQVERSKNRRAQSTKLHRLKHG